jgi:hypothetical protein
MARLAALVPTPRMHLTRYHGVLAPHSQHRAAVTPAHQRVFDVEIERCTRCGGQLKIIASIEEPQLIAKILSHLESVAAQQSQSELPLGARGPPVQSRLL